MTQVIGLGPDLFCPACHGELSWDEPTRPECLSCGATYQVRDGIGSFRLDSDETEWEQVDSALRQRVEADPDIRRALLETPPDDLAPADLFFRGFLLEEEEQYLEADSCIRAARGRCYRSEYLDAQAAEIAYVASHVAGRGTVVDVASGRGTLVEALLSHPDSPSSLVATDLSPLVLERMKRRFAARNIGRELGHLAFDAATSPFRDGRVETATTLLGLPNMAEPERALRELRRVVTGELLAISYFIDQEDPPGELRPSRVLLRAECLSLFAETGWSVEVANEIVAPASPTPEGVIFAGWGIDGFPIVETRLTWCVVVAS